jgi:hypothetical protein
MRTCHRDLPENVRACRTLNGSVRRPSKAVETLRRLLHGRSGNSFVTAGFEEFRGFCGIFDISGLQFPQFCL